MWSGMESVVWPVHDEQLQLAIAVGIIFQKSATFKPTALLSASR